MIEIEHFVKILTLLKTIEDDQNTPLKKCAKI